MVSPKSRSHASADHIEESNTTANLFLGGVRRNWMGPQTNAPESSATRNPRVEADLTVPPNSLPQAVLMSPVTPGETLNQAPSRRPIHTKVPDTRTTTLPSPVPSTNSHPSPVKADAIVSSRPPTLPPISTQLTAQRGDDERMAVQPPNGLATSQSATHSPLMGPNRATNSPSNTGTRTGHNTQGSIVSGSQPSLLQIGGTGAAAIPNEIWEQWSGQLDVLVNELSAKGAIPARSRDTTITRPRIQLLRNAISRKDAFYLVMHQLYCRYSLDPSTLGQIRAPESGMRSLIPLLEDNGKMHDAAVIVFAHFPASPQQLIQSSWYLRVLSGVPEFLARLATEWQGVLNHSLQVHHPPLVSHLWQTLACPSPILMSVMFTCAARRLHHDSDIEPLLELFWKDLKAFQRCKESEAPETTQQALNWQITQEYLNFPRSSESQTPSSSHPVRPPRPQNQTMSQAPPPSHPRSSVAGVSQPAANSPALTPLGAPLQPLHSNLPQGQVVGPPGYQFGVNSPMQNTPQSPYYNPMSQGQGQWQGTGPWYPVNSHMNHHMNHHVNPQMSPQMQMHMQAAGQVPPSRRHQALPGSHGQQMQRRTMPTSSVAPANSSTASLQPSALTSAHPSPSLHAPSPISTTPTTTNHMAQYSLPPQRPNNHYNRQHSMNLQSSASPSTRMPPQGQPPPGQHFQPLPNSPLLPLPGHRAPMMVNPNPTRFGLHQVDLRDPMKKLVKRSSDGNEVETDLFTYLDTFVVHPTFVNVEQSIYTWNFSFTHDEHQKFPHVAHGKEGQYSIWTFRPGCRTIRLRCIRLPGDPNTVTEQTWSTASTFWPSVFYITVNDKELYVRRKVHNGKDLPLDITENLKAGENSVRLDMILGQDECKTSKYVFGVEVMEVAEFDQILSLVQSISAADSRAAIKKRLSPITDDDDLAVVTDNLTIDLVDPFMARIFDVPVRSRHCNHHECFDRDTFIRTRKSVSGPTPMVDNWRCPICKGDARPQFLVVDQFLVEVHAQLARTNRLSGIRAIQIKVDGTWIPKYDTDEASPAADRPFSPKRKAEGPLGPVAVRTKNDVSSGSHSPAVHTQEPTVIELD
ncbi:hypothetical protein N7530_001747 [Penicillium desertorum]|uniref:SP-RING-type domain-containing protein n=1 Tax=Penicillium desertorum TaxID=1303715 RepID=A0A9W9XAT4_9EURO|nr:hypothetical protein N7530_001747 [Penicillium desertorum]